ncbi:hypothetical protein ACO0QE_002001 [Hanseniaspora vineae]
MSPGIIHKFNETLQFNNGHKIDGDIMVDESGSNSGTNELTSRGNDSSSRSNDLYQEDQEYDYNEDDSQIFERCVQDLGLEDDDTSTSGMSTSKTSTNAASGFNTTSEGNEHIFTNQTVNPHSSSFKDDSPYSNASSHTSNAKHKADKIHRRRSNANQMMLQLSRSNSNTTNGYGSSTVTSTPSSSATSFKSCSQFAGSGNGNSNGNGIFINNGANSFNSNVNGNSNTNSTVSTSPTLPQVAYALSRQRSSSLANSPSSIPTHICCLERYVQQDLDTLAMSDTSSTNTNSTHTSVANMSSVSGASANESNRGRNSTGGMSTSRPNNININESAEHSRHVDRMNAYRLNKSRTSGDLDITPVAAPGSGTPASTNPFYSRSGLSGGVDFASRSESRSESRNTPIAHPPWDNLNMSDEQLCENTFTFINNSRQGSTRSNYYFDKLENYAGLGSKNHGKSAGEAESSRAEESGNVVAEAMRPRMTRRVSLMTMALSESLPPLGRRNTAPNGMYEHS